MKTRNSNNTAKKAAKPARMSASADDVLELLGINAFARLNGASPETALAIAATVLQSSAGPTVWIAGLCGPAKLPDLNILIAPARGATLRLIDRLTGPALMMSHRLAQNMAGYSPDVMDCILNGPFGGAIPAKMASAEATERILARHHDALRPQHTANNLYRDLEFNEGLHRIEAMLNPEFVLTSTKGRDLVSHTQNCHLRASLIVQPRLGLDRSGTEPHQAVKDLTDLISGVLSSSRSGRSNRTPGHLKARVILTASEEDLTFISNFAAPLIAELLWLADKQPDAPLCKDTESASVFRKAYQESIDKLVALRREGRERLLNFCQEKAAVLFDARMREYEAKLDAMPINPGASARALPPAIYWALSILRQSLPDTRQPTEEDLIATAFKTADSLLTDHSTQMRALMNAKLVKQRQLIARRVVTELASKTSLRFRDISRLFTNQQKERYEPVLQPMVELGVLGQDGEGRYALGPVELEDVEELLTEMFRPADCPAIALPKAGPPKNQEKKQPGPKSLKSLRPVVDTIDTFGAAPRSHVRGTSLS